MAQVVLSVDVDAPPEEVWAAAVDWDRQGEWMLATRSWQASAGPPGVGTRAAAWTGLGPLGFLDTMRVTHWDPPRRCLVQHDGRVVRGTGSFEVEELPGRRARFVWSDWVELPLGVLGELGFLVVGPVFRAGMEYSLRRFARQVEANRERLSSDTP